MQYSLALAILVATIFATPSSVEKRAPEGCDTTYMDGSFFQIGIVNASTAGSKMIKVCPILTYSTINSSH